MTQYTRVLWKLKDPQNIFLESLLIRAFSSVSPVKFANFANFSPATFSVQIDTHAPSQKPIGKSLPTMHLRITLDLGSDFYVCHFQCMIRSTSPFCVPQKNLRLSLSIKQVHQSVFPTVEEIFPRLNCKCLPQLHAKPLANSSRSGHNPQSFGGFLETVHSRP